MLFIEYGIVDMENFFVLIMMSIMILAAGIAVFATFISGRKWSSFLTFMGKYVLRNDLRGASYESDAAYYLNKEYIYYWIEEDLIDALSNLSVTHDDRFNSLQLFDNVFTEKRINDAMENSKYTADDISEEDYQKLFDAYSTGLNKRVSVIQRRINLDPDDKSVILQELIDDKNRKDRERNEPF